MTLRTIRPEETAVDAAATRSDGGNVPGATHDLPTRGTASAGAARTPGTQWLYRPELDGLRLIAFLAVFAHHTLQFGNGGHHRVLPAAIGRTLNLLATMGTFGVDLFFVLSAYLITSLLLRERAIHGGIDVQAFYLRRVLRIWPLYVVCLALAYGITFFVATEQFTLSHLAAFLLFSGNWIYILRPVTTIAAPLWSISVEEQFYLVWPWVVRRASRARLVAVAAAVIAVGLLARLILALQGTYGFWISKNTLTRIDGIAVGVLVAVALGGRTPTLGGRARLSLGVAGVALWAWVAADFGLFNATVRTWAQTLGWPLVALGAALLLLAVLGGDRSQVGWLQSRPVVYLGRISYGLYALHQVGLLAANRLFPGYGQSGVQWVAHWCVALGLTILLAAVSYRWLERPFLRWKDEQFTYVHSAPPGIAARRLSRPS